MPLRTSRTGTSHPSWGCSSAITLDSGNQPALILSPPLLPRHCLTAETCPSHSTTRNPSSYQLHGVIYLITLILLENPSIRPPFIHRHPFTYPYIHTSTIHISVIHAYIHHTSTIRTSTIPICSSIHSFIHLYIYHSYMHHPYIHHSSIDHSFIHLSINLLYIHTSICSSMHPPSLTHPHIHLPHICPCIYKLTIHMSIHPSICLDLYGSRTGDLFPL